MGGFCVHHVSGFCISSIRRWFSASCHVRCGKSDGVVAWFDGIGNEIVSRRTCVWVLIGASGVSRGLKVPQTAGLGSADLVGKSSFDDSDSPDNCG